jgi:hypothetical protein
MSPAARSRTSKLALKDKSVQPISLKLPLAYLRILEAEADRLGLRRGQFLTLLLQRKRGEINFDRPATAPVYKATDRELRESKVWLWYTTPQFRKLIDEDRFQMGINTISAWVTQLLNHWLARPQGLRYP